MPPCHHPQTQRSPAQLLQGTTNREPISTGLLTLPPEVLLHIYSSITHSPSQISWALTCKHLSRLASRSNLNLSTASPRYAGFLPVSVFDVPDLMVYLKPWMPSHLRLCGHCLTYRPFSAEYWQKVPGHERNDFWVSIMLCLGLTSPACYATSYPLSSFEVEARSNVIRQIQKTGWIFKDAGWRKQTHDICPACHDACTLSDYVPCDGWYVTPSKLQSAIQSPT